MLFKLICRPYETEQEARERFADVYFNADIGYQGIFYKLMQAQTLERTLCPEHDTQAISALLCNRWELFCERAKGAVRTIKTELSCREAEPLFISRQKAAIRLT